MSSRPDSLPLTLVRGAELLRRPLPSGGSLVIASDGDSEQLELRSPTGELEVCIVLTASGPVVKLRAARIEVESPEVTFRCDKFAVDAAHGVKIATSGTVAIDADELRAQTVHDVHLNGAFIRLNCTPAPDAPGEPDAPDEPDSITRK